MLKENPADDWHTEREKLLQSKLCELGLKIEGTRLEKIVDDLYEELESAKIRLKPKVRLYGDPDDFRCFVDASHRVGLGVILDVVYNHVGPDGNYLKEFSTDYFTDRYKNNWGAAINFDGEKANPVREFFLTNAAYWIEEYHIDGLRLHATQDMFDASAENILTAIGKRVREAARGRKTIIVAENEPQVTKLVRPVEGGGYGLDALWNDDFHHSAMVAMTGRNEAYFTDYLGKPRSSSRW